MDNVESKEYMRIQLATNIRNKFSNVYDLLYYMDSEEKFKVLKELSQLIKEFLSDDDINKKFIELANNSTVKENSTNNELKVKAFEVIRNILIHFPIFEKWDDVFLTKNLLNWSNSKSNTILNFFENNKNSEIDYVIYTKEDDRFSPTHPIKMKILPLDDKKPVFLKDMITEDEVIWTFALIDYYLNYMGLGLDYDFYISA
jgi:hypothetical protein